MFGPQVVAGMVMEKAALLNPTRALELMDEEPWQSAPRSAWFRYYVDGLSAGSDWAEVASRLGDYGDFHEKGDGPTLVFGTDNHPPRYTAMGKTPKDELLKRIAVRWGEEDLDDAVRWFTDEHDQEFSDPESASVISQGLPGWYQEGHVRAIDWIEEQELGSDWKQEVLVRYGERMAFYPPGEQAFRILSMIDQRGTRRAVVEKFMGKIETPSATGHVSFRHKVEELRPLVEAARMDEDVRAAMLEMLETGKWQALPN